MTNKEKIHMMIDTLEEARDYAHPMLMRLTELQKTLYNAQEMLTNSMVKKVQLIEGLDTAIRIGREPNDEGGFTTDNYLHPSDDASPPLPYLPPTSGRPSFTTTLLLLPLLLISVGGYNLSEQLTKELINQSIKTSGESKSTLSSTDIKDNISPTIVSGETKEVKELNKPCVNCGSNTINSSVHEAQILQTQSKFKEALVLWEKALEECRNEKRNASLELGEACYCSFMSADDKTTLALCNQLFHEVDIVKDSKYNMSLSYYIQGLVHQRSKDYTKAFEQFRLSFMSGMKRASNRLKELSLLTK